METIEDKGSTRDVFKTSWKTISFAWKKERKLFIIVFLLAALLSVVVLLQLASFAGVVNEIIRIKELGLGITHILINRSIMLAISFLAPAALQNLQERYLDEFILRMFTHMRILLIDSFSRLDIGTIEGPEFQAKSELTQKWGIGSITNTLRRILQLFSDIVSLIAAGFLLFSISSYLVLLAIIGSITYYFVENKYSVELFRLYWLENNDSRIEDDRFSYFKAPKKIVEVLLFGLKKYFREQILSIATHAAKKITKIKVRESLAIFGADFLQITCLCIAIVLVTYQTLHGTLLVGSLLLAFSVYRSFVGTSQQFFGDFSQLQEQARFAKYWFDIFSIKPKIMSVSNALRPVWDTPPGIEFKNISFAYPGTKKMVLKNISFTINSGEKLAFVGLNGAGKTTLIKILCRVYDPTKGQVLIDGIDLKNIDLELWREYLGVLFQDFNNYQMTVREAIAISRPNEPIDDDRVRFAAQLSGAEDFIKELPKKYNQLLWKGFKDGVELSKGQFQRMAVARIFYRDALISVLDEPTSAIDAVAEEKIFEVLETKMEGKTVVLISHRFSTVKNADKIAVIEHGELKELGNHKELMEKNGRYAELYTMQAKRYLESE